MNATKQPNKPTRRNDKRNSKFGVVIVVVAVLVINHGSGELKRIASTNKIAKNKPFFRAHLIEFKAYHIRTTTTTLYFVLCLNNIPSFR